MGANPQYKPKKKQVYGGGRGSPEATFLYEAGILGVGEAKKHFENIGYSVDIKARPLGPGAREYNPLASGIISPHVERLPTVDIVGLETRGPKIKQTTRAPAVESFPGMVERNVWRPLEEKVFTPIDRVVLAPIQAVEERAIKPVARWVAGRAERARRGDMLAVAGLVAGAIGLSALKFGEGVYEGATAVVRPWSIVRGVGTLVSKPHMVAEYYAENPLELPRLAGGFVGGAMVGKAVGKTYSRIKTRKALPEDYILEPREFKPFFRQTARQGEYLVRRIDYVERGEAIRVPSLGSPEHLLGETGVRFVKRGDWTYAYMEKIRYPGRELVTVEAPVKTAFSTPVGSGESVVSKLFHVIGKRGKGSPVIASLEKAFYGGKLVEANYKALTGIKIRVSRTLFKPPRTEYTAYGSALTVSRWLGGEAGGVAPVIRPSLLSAPHGYPTVRVPVEYNIEFPELGFFSMPSSLPRFTPGKASRSIARPRINISPRPSLYPRDLGHIVNMERTSTVARAGMKAVPRLRMELGEAIVSETPRVPSMKTPPLLAIERHEGRKTRRTTRKHRRNKRLGYMEQVFPAVSAPL